MARGAGSAGALAVSALSALALVLGTAQAQQNSNRTLTQVERDRSAANSRATELRRQADAARGEAAALDARLVEAGIRRSNAQTAAAAAQLHLAALRVRTTSDAARYRRDRAAFESALITAAFASRRIETSAVRAGIFARAAAPEFHRGMTQASASLDEVQRLSDAIAEEQAILADAQAAIDSERAEIVTLAERRRAAQRALIADAGAAERRARQFAAEARTLRELTQRLASQQPRSSSGRNSSSGAALPTSWLAPAEGQIARNFGASVAGGPPAQGIALRTASGAQVVAPAAGEIAYAGLFRSYGQVLILNVDNGYALVLTGLDTLNARTGDTVRAGQSIGAMSDSATTAPELYVEVRRNGQPVDPARWLSARGLTAASTSGRTG